MINGLPHLSKRWISTLSAPALTTAALVALAIYAQPVPVSAAPQGNPIRSFDTADPGVVRADGKWYIYHTSSGTRYKNRYPILQSDDLTSWTVIGNIFPAAHIPAWAKKATSWWAPEVHKVGAHYIAYFTTREDSTNRFVVGAAIANSPAGPFKDIGQPLLRDKNVGLIDVSFFNDPRTGKCYLIWKEDGNDFSPPHPTPLRMSELTPDGLHLIGPHRELIRNDQPWEGVLVEAPSLIYHQGWYYLFYSGNIFVDDGYSVGVARSRDVWGPYEKQPKPIMVHDKYFSGPAHQFVIQDEKGAWHMFYHARLKQLQRGYRFLMHDMITWGADGWPHINDGHPGGPLNQNVVNQIEANLHRSAARNARTSATITTSPEDELEVLE